MDGHALLSYCGLYCGGCRSFGENSEVGCRGCRAEPEMVSDCPTRACAIGRGLLHCGECGDFPCDVLHGFYTDGIPHHALACENMEELRSVGPGEWLRLREVESVCTCGARRLWLAAECVHDGGGRP
jgi:hypothetical protein